MLGNAKNDNVHTVECLGPPRNARCMARLVAPLSPFHFPSQTHLLGTYRSMIFFITAILTFVWRSGSTTDPETPSPLSPSASFGPRIVVSAFFLLGLAYFAAIVKTLQSYGHRRIRQEDRGDYERGRARKRNPFSGESNSRDRGDVRSSGNGRSGSGRRNKGDQQDRDNYTREQERHVHDTASDPVGGLSAVMGLGLRGLDSFAGPQSHLQEKHTEEEGVGGKH